MKILHTVEFYYPSIGGAQEAVKQLSERLVKLGHEVTVASTKLTQRAQLLINGVQIKEFDISGNQVRGYKGDIAKYQTFLLESDYDIVMNYAAQEWTMDLAFPILKGLKAKKIMVPCGFSGLYDSRYSEYFLQMRTWMKQYDALVFMAKNYRDHNYAKRFRLSKKHFIPNGAGIDEFCENPSSSIRIELGVPSDHFLIITVGSHSGVKDHKETMAAFKKAKVHKATLLIIANQQSGGCGKACIRQANWSRYDPRLRMQEKRIMVRELNRTQTVSAFKEADLFVFASNIECSPLVLFEAAASHTPFLTGNVGNATEIIKWTEGGLLIPTVIDERGYSHVDITGYCEMIEYLYNNPSIRRSMAEEGYKHWKKSFTWEHITKQYEALYRSLL